MSFAGHTGDLNYFMWRSIVVFFEIAVLVFVLHLPVVQHIFEDAQQVVTGWFEYAASWQDRNEMDALNKLTVRQREDMRPYQQDYVAEIMKDRQSIKLFHDKFCGKDEINPFMKGAELAQFCHSIESTKLLSQTR